MPKCIRLCCLAVLLLILVMPVSTLRAYRMQPMTIEPSLTLSALPFT